MSPSISLKLSLLAAVAAAALTLPHARGANLLANGDFETGQWNPTLTGAGSTATALSWGPQAIADEWIVGNSGFLQELWIENPAMAQSGDRFAWLRGGGTSMPAWGPAVWITLSYYRGVAGSNALVPGSPPATTFGPGVTYELSLWVANAGSEFAGLPVPVTLSLWGGSTVDIPVNPSWSDTAASIIPWQEVKVTFNTPAELSANLLTAYARGSGSVFPTPEGSKTSLVIDHMELRVVPEPATGMLAVAGMLGMAGRRRTRR